MKPLVLLIGFAVGCPEPKPGGVPPDPADSGAIPEETGQAETGRAEDTAPTCPEPPWRTAVAGDPADLGAGEGLSTGEQEAAETIRAALLTDPGVSAVFWREAGTDRYQIHTAAGGGAFTRSRDASGDLQLSWEGSAPLRDDPMADPDLESALSHGNPEGTTYPEQGYESGDPRLSFPSLEDASYPRIMERIAQIFDAPNGPDLGLALTPWSGGGVGTHGSMGLAQSRAPLVLRGPGVVPGRYAFAADQVDIAPTVAGLLGVDPVRGVDGRRGRWVEGQLLRWQDGRVLDELLEVECAHGAAPRAVVIILDGMNHTELLDGVAEGRTPNIGRIVDTAAAVVEGGAITGWPTFSLPGHYSVHTGAYQGHHGLLSNSFQDRLTGETVPGVSLSDALADPASGAAALEAHLSSEVETLFEAVSRTDSEAVTATINELTFRGASWSLLSASGPPPPGVEDYTRYSFADEAAVLQVAHMLDEVGPPTYLALSLYLTDAAGEGEGPHGDGLRDAMTLTDERIGRILDLYADAGVFEDTLWVLTADHGMSLQDSARTSAWSSALTGTGIPTTSHGRMVVIQ